MKEEKRCWIRTRYLVKRTGSICAKIVNGGGIEYTTCLHRNGAHSCDCKAGQRGVLCYHVKHLQAKEAERKKQHVEAKRSAETVEKVPVPAQAGKDSQRHEQEAAAPIMHLKNTQRKRAETVRKPSVSKPTGNDTQSFVSGFSERKVEERAEEAAPADVERMMNAPLTGNRPFWLMR